MKKRPREITTMATRQDKLDNKLINYLGENMDMCGLLELWEKIDSNFLSADEFGVADYMVYCLGSDVVLNELAAPLVEQLVSEDKWEQQDAVDKMQEMGYDMTKLGDKR